MKSINILKCQVFKERDFEYGSICCASEAVGVFRKLMENSAEEFFWMICLDAKGKIVGAHEVSHGDLTTAPVHPREIYKRAILNNAASIIVSHNHPSGDPNPSSEDISLTARIKEAGKLMGITLLDHIIIGDSDYYSFAGAGALNS